MPQPGKCCVDVAPVAQLDRAPDFESGGQGFESLPARQFSANKSKHYTGSADTGRNGRPFMSALCQQGPRWCVLTASGPSCIRPGRLNAWAAALIALSRICPGGHTGLRAPTGPVPDRSTSAAPGSGHRRLRAGRVRQTGPDAHRRSHDRFPQTGRHRSCCALACREIIAARISGKGSPQRRAAKGSRFDHKRKATALDTDFSGAESGRA